MTDRFEAWALALAGTLAAVPAAAADTPTRPPAVAACQACHGPAGISDSDSIPNLAGQKKAYLVAQLEAFKRGERKNDLMAAIAGQLSPAEMLALAQFWSALPAASAATATAAPTPIRPRMEFPAAFPKGFSVYQTVAENGQVAKRYANAAALGAARDGQALPVGAVIVVATHAAQLDAAQRPLLGSDGQPVAGQILSYAAMEARAGWGAEIPELLRNGDWGYALFTAERVRRDGANQAPCLACHKPISADSHVFTLQALKASAASSPPR